jgi:hypothetical protein
MPRTTKQSQTARRPQSQVDRFREIARALECDEDKERFEEKLRRIAKAKPKPKSETE